MSTKGDIVTGAYQEIRISGLTVTPSPSDDAMALSRLESMAAQYQAQYNFNIGFNFEVTPNLNSQSGIPLEHEDMFRTNLAVMLVAAFGKDAPPSLAGRASGAFSASIGSNQAQNLQFIQPPRRMPVGNGNTFRGIFWNRFAIPVANAPDAPSTVYMYQGMTLNLFEDFSAFLGDATIASFTMAADPLLTISNTANASPRITYTATAPDDQSSYGPLQQVKITITDTLGRTLIRMVNFQIIPAPVVQGGVVT